jgi:hypothetical protein
MSTHAPGNPWGALHNGKAPPEWGFSSGEDQADFFFGAAFLAATGLVTVGLAPTTAGCAACARLLP